MTDVDAEDIVVLHRQLCIVTEVSDPFSTSLPLDSDKSANSKVAITITGWSILWPKIKYEGCFLYHDDNRIGTFSGTPKLYEVDLVIPLLLNQRR